MNHCYLCDVELSDLNASSEHILPQSIGGKLKSKQLICKICNNTTGHIYDSNFSKIGGFLASKYMPNKNKLRATFEATEINTGAKLLILPDFKIAYVDPESKYDNKGIYVKHYDKNRAFEEIKKISRALGDKDFDKKDIITVTTPVEKRDNKKIDFLYDVSIEPPLLLRSVSKTIINTYLHFGGNKKNCLPLINFLKNDTELNLCWFLDLNLNKKYNLKNTHNIVIIKGDKKQRILYEYFEVFGEMGFLAMLNSKYEDQDLEINYIFNSETNKDIEIKLELNLNRGEIIDFLIACPESEILKCIHHHWSMKN